MTFEVRCSCGHDEDAHHLRQFADICHLPHCDQCCEVNQGEDYHDRCFDCAGFMAAKRRTESAYIPLVEAAEAQRAQWLVVSDILDTIVATQNINWSRDIYPLRAALTAAGFDGRSPAEAKAWLEAGRPFSALAPYPLTERAIRAKSEAAALVQVPGQQQELDGVGGVG